MVCLLVGWLSLTSILGGLPCFFYPPPPILLPHAHTTIYCQLLFPVVESRFKQL